METVIVGKYEVREPVVGDVPELFELMIGGSNVNMNNLVSQMVRNCVFVDGQPIGEGLSQIPIRDLKTIIAELVRMAGLSEKK